MTPYLFVGGPRHGEFVGVRADDSRLPITVMVPIAAPVTVIETHVGPRIAQYERKSIADVTVYVFLGITS